MAIVTVCKVPFFLRVKTGLRIGGELNEYEIGGVDNITVKLPDGKPYIPGSSLKGKLRSLAKELENSSDDAENIRILMGNDPESPESKQGILLIRDLFIAEDKDLEKAKHIFVLDKDDNFDIYWEKAKEMNFIEIKAENKIERKNGKSTPRSIERVIPNTIFKGEFIFKINNETQDYKNAVKLLKKALKLLEYDYLGHAGSRGYGAVEIKGTGEDGRFEVEHVIGDENIAKTIESCLNDSNCSDEGNINEINTSSS